MDALNSLPRIVRGTSALEVSFCAKAIYFVFYLHVDAVHEWVPVLTTIVHDSVEAEQWRRYLLDLVRPIGDLGDSKSFLVELNMAAIDKGVFPKAVDSILGEFTLGKIQYSHKDKSKKDTPCGIFAGRGGILWGIPLRSGEILKITTFLDQCFGLEALA